MGTPVGRLKARNRRRQPLRYLTGRGALCRLAGLRGSLLCPHFPTGLLGGTAVALTHALEATAFPGLAVALIHAPKLALRDLARGDQEEPALLLESLSSFFSNVRPLVCFFSPGLNKSLPLSVFVIVTMSVLPSLHGFQCIFIYLVLAET